MGGKLIIIAGHLAAGKSTFARRLSKELLIPCFIKDAFKSALCAGVSIENRAESSRFSAMTFDAMLHAAEQLCTVGLPVILEGNFVPAGVKPVDEAGAIRQLAARYAYSVLTYLFVGDTRVLHDRFVLRENSTERERANRLGTPLSYADFDRCCRNLARFSAGGEEVTVDVTDFGRVDFGKYIRMARTFAGLPDEMERQGPQT